MVSRCLLSLVVVVLAWPCGPGAQDCWTRAQDNDPSQFDDPRTPVIPSPAAAAANLEAQGPDEATEKHIRQLIQRLGDRSYRNRERAERELRSLGLLALESLQSVEDHEDIEIRIRARSLVSQMRGKMIAEGVPPELADLLRNYDKLPLERRQQLISSLALQRTELKLGVLVRLARFEASELLAKEAALAILNIDLDESGRLAEHEKTIKSAIGFSRRKPIQWIRAYLRSYSTFEDAVQELEDLVDQERLIFRTLAGKSNMSIIDRLIRFRIDLLLRSAQRARAIEAMADLEVGDRPTSLWELAEWMMDREAWSAVEDLAKRYEERFAEDSLLLYLLAESLQSDRREEQTKEVAERAFATGGRGVVNYVIAYRKTMSRFGVAESLGQAPGAEATRRFAVARVLEDERGLTDWAEREYRAVLPEKIEDALGFNAHLALSEMLHDLAKERQAGEVLQVAVDRMEESEDIRTLVVEEIGRVPNDLISQMHLYFGLYAGEQGDYQRQMSELSKGLVAQRRNADLLIAMFRVQEPTDEFQAETRQAITQVADEIFQEIVTYRKEVKQARNNTTRQMNNFELADRENEYAWLVGNTMGDIEEAIRCSEHSLEVIPLEGGLLDTLARCYFRQGDLEKAVEVQRRAAQRLPHEQQILRQLAVFERALADRVSPDGRDE